MLAAASSSERQFPGGGRGTGRRRESLQAEAGVPLAASAECLTGGAEEPTECNAGSGPSNLEGPQEVRSGREHGGKRDVQAKEEPEFLCGGADNSSAEGVCCTVGVGL